MTMTFLSSACRFIYEVFEVFRIAQKGGLPNRPSWDIAPAWANWLAQDLSGTWFWFEYKPDLEKQFGLWSSIGGRSCIAYKSELRFDWQTSLSKRKTKPAP